MWQAATLALGFALMAAALRYGAGYPLCHNDEKNWAFIAGQLDQGVDWPVSGPAFIHVVRTLAQHRGASHPAALAWLGIGGVFVAICALLWGYRRIGIGAPGACLLALALTSYFWAPLLEARPQQWGQVLVFAGALCAWLWLNRQGGWAIFVLLALATFTHILSHAILIFVCVTLSLADWAEGRPFTRRHALLLAALACSAAVYAWPGGPYARMLQDVVHNHMPRLLAVAFWLALGAGAIGAGVFFIQRRWHWRAQWSHAAAAVLARHQTAVWLGTACLLFAMLTLQARMLPDAAWGPYGGSVWRFAVFQSGNVIFAALFVLGLLELARRLRTAEASPLMSRFLIWTLISFGLLAFIAIVASRWLLDTNWFLRVLNYGVLFAAPVVGLGLARAAGCLRPRHALYALVVLAASASKLSVLRPPGMLGC